MVGKNSMIVFNTDGKKIREENVEKIAFNKEDLTINTEEFSSLPNEEKTKIYGDNKEKFINERKYKSDIRHELKTAEKLKARIGQVNDEINK